MTYQTCSGTLLCREILSKYTQNCLLLAMVKKNFGYVAISLANTSKQDLYDYSLSMFLIKFCRVFRLGRPLVKGHSERYGYSLTVKLQEPPYHTQLYSRVGSPLVFGGISIPIGIFFKPNSVHRPIAAYGALDLPTYFLDVTPFVPLLTDGKSHQFTIDVVSAEDDHTILQNWYVSGLLQIITDSSSEPTTGKMTVYNASPFAKATNTATIGDEVSITVKATRSIHIEADIKSGSGKTTHAIWSQDLSYSNIQTYKNNAVVQVYKISTMSYSQLMSCRYFGKLPLEECWLPTMASRPSWMFSPIL